MRQDIAVFGSLIAVRTFAVAITAIARTIAGAMVGAIVGHGTVLLVTLAEREAQAAGIGFQAGLLQGPLQRPRVAFQKFECLWPFRGDQRNNPAIVADFQFYIDPAQFRWIQPDA